MNPTEISRVLACCSSPICHAGRSIAYLKPEYAGMTQPKAKSSLRQRLKEWLRKNMPTSR